LHLTNCTAFDLLAPAFRRSAKTPATNRLSLRLPELTFPPYAEAHCTQQNAQISGETLQDYRSWEGLEIAFLATPFVVDEKRKAQTPARQNSARPRNGCGAGKSESSFRLKGRDVAYAVRTLQCSVPI